MKGPSVAEAFLAIGRQLSDTERAVDRLPLPAAERTRARRMASSAREAVAEAMTSAGHYLEHAASLGGRS